MKIPSEGELIEMERRARLMPDVVQYLKRRAESSRTAEEVRLHDREAASLRAMIDDIAAYTALCRELRDSR